MKRVSIWRVVFWAGLGIAVLCGLGTWQIFRLGEKQALLAEIAARAAAAPITLGEALARREKGDSIEFVRVTATGLFDQANELQKLAAFDGNPGWEIITPFTSSEGIVALVDRGVVPDELHDKAKRPEPAQQVEITAIARAHDNARGFFDPENNADGRVWYWWDVPAMLSSVAIPADMKVAPFVLQVLPGNDVMKFPRAGAPEVALTNNHLQYAITWFSLALVLLVMSGLFIRKLVRITDA